MAASHEYAPAQRGAFCEAVDPADVVRPIGGRAAGFEELTQASNACRLHFDGVAFDRDESNFHAQDDAGQVDQFGT